MGGTKANLSVSGQLESCGRSTATPDNFQGQTRWGRQRPALSSPGTRGCSEDTEEQPDQCPGKTDSSQKSQTGALSDAGKPAWEDCSVPPEAKHRPSELTWEQKSPTEGWGSRAPWVAREEPGEPEISTPEPALSSPGWAGTHLQEDFVGVCVTVTVLC